MAESSPLLTVILFAITAPPPFGARDFRFMPPRGAFFPFPAPRLRHFAHGFVPCRAAPRRIMPGAPRRMAVLITF
jgi:hypothetical protein